MGRMDENGGSTQVRIWIGLIAQELNVGFEPQSQNELFKAMPLRSFPKHKQADGLLVANLPEGLQQVYVSLSGHELAERDRDRDAIAFGKPGMGIFLCCEVADCPEFDRIVYRNRLAASDTEVLA